MIKYLSRAPEWIACLIISIFYSQTVLSAYCQAAEVSQYPVIAQITATTSSLTSSERDSSGELAIIKRANPDAQVNFRQQTVDKIDAARKNIAASRKETGGPTQPEMTSFKSVNDNNMVDLFSGDFSYNIPLLDVGGYPVNIFYHSGITMDQEASWVGLGWNINPGTISRNLRGIPDDFDGKNDTIQKTTSIAENKTVGGDVGGDIELTGLPLHVGASLGVFYNNYRGWGMENGLNASIAAGFASMGKLSGGLSITNNSQQGLTIAPSLSVGIDKQFSDNNSTVAGGVSIGGGFAYNSRSGLVGNLSTGVNLSIEQSKNIKDKHSDPSPLSELFGAQISFASPSYIPSATLPFTSSQFTFTGKLGLEQFTLHPDLYIKGYVTKQYIAPEDIHRSYPAYGYLYFQDANDNPQALLDFNREKDIVYRESPPVPNIAVPSYTYDLFNINGEGSGGMFRIYRGDIGFVHDPYVTTKDNSFSGSIDLGFGNLFHGGVDFYVNRANTTTGSWVDGNPLANALEFKQPDSVYEAAYLRNPGEKSINSKDFYANVGDDDVVTAQLYQAGNGPVITSTNVLQHWKNKTASGTTTTLNNSSDFKTKRDKRTQVISYLTASEAARVGLDTVIYSYGLNQWGNPHCSDIVQTEPRVNSFRQPNHMSEIDVLNTDGRRYVYGLPVYNLVQKEVTFAADSSKANRTTGMVQYGGNDATESNNHGVDHYYQKEITGAYAHSFLLTGILSPDYVDLTGNGITDDDLGDAIKFNYTKLAGISNPFGWRTPYTSDSATYNEGLQTYVRDDKGNYIYGEKEMWYLNSIESKNMIAVFVLESRSDLHSISETGVISTMDTTRSKRLKEIDLYSKSDYIQNGTSARPIKTVHFGYGYDLCKGINGDTSQGKLTLKKVWFTYNGNQKGVKNPYLFFYNTANPKFANASDDRWGNYKSALQNPRSSQSNLITNAEYPYSLQDSSKININAAAWTMDSIVLPSTGSIKVGYESDDYAYVQNKRAMQMYNVIGLSALAPTSISNISKSLYNVSTEADNLFVAIRVSSPVSSAKDAYQKYLEGFQKIYFKLKVQMPSDEWGSGYEYVPVYADLDISSIADSAHYGTIAGHPDIVWVNLQGISLDGTGTGSYSPLVKAATQFLRMNLPSKAYPGYEVGDKLDVEVAVKMIMAMGGNIIHAFSSFDKEARDNGWCVTIDTARTLARLDNPTYKKYGGGLRVKFIKIYDNWKNMTDSSKQSVYGQVYDYTAIKNIDGVDIRISSGVANWEPMLGGEENPFRLPLEYTEKVAPLAPVSNGYTELPLGETFFPAPSVGYSQVRVSSIHLANIKSANGYEETKFYTSYDFPTITDNSLFTPDTKKRYKTSLSDFLRIRSEHFLTMSQGFKIELNDMNGKMKSQSSYSQLDSLHPIASSTYYYHVDDQNAEFKHLNNTVYAVNETGLVDTTATIGKDIELMTDMREQHSLSEGADYGVNVDLFVIFVFPIPIPSYIPIPQKEETRFQSVAMTKVINRFGILDSVVAIDKGSKVSTDNLLYDSETGDPVLTRTRNEFNDTLYNFSYPAHWAYSGMGPAYQNIDASYTHDASHDIQIVNGALRPTSKYPGMISRFESGDEIMAVGQLKTGQDTVENCSGVTECPIPIFSSAFTTEKLWAVNSKKLDPASTLGIVFIDRDGNPYSGDSLNLKIIRSGHRNLSATPIGAVTMLNSPIRTVSGKLELVIDSNRNVLATMAASFNDTWRIPDSRKSVHFSYTCACGPLKELFDYLISSHRLFIQQSDNVTVGQLVADANTAGKDISINDCSVLKNNSSFLFYASTTDSIANSYSAHIGYNTISIQSNDGLPIHFYSLESQDCNGENRVYYTDSYNPMQKYLLWNSSGHSSTFHYEDCHGDASGNGITLNNGDDVELCALKDGLHLPGDGSIQFEEEDGTCADTCNSSREIYLSIDSCEDCLNGTCFNPVLDTTFNPYVYGALGNWRSQKSYVYYGKRRESDPSVIPNIRNNGVIQNFFPYWSFGNTYLTATTDTSTYVWNSQSTLYNKKGFEVENKDPLGRYNAGAYGYNESLPISVVQNSQYKDQFFDGFEDYGYTTQTCSVECPIPKNVNFATDGASITDTVSHSGKYSLKLNALDSSTQTFAIISKPYIDSQKINLDVDATSFIDTVVSPVGDDILTTHSVNGNIDEYTGYLQANVSGYYNISSVIGYMHVHVGGETPYYTLTVDGIHGNSDTASGPARSASVTVYLTAGDKVVIEVDAFEDSYFTTAPNFTWQRLGSCGTGITGIPASNIYSWSANDNVACDSTVCISRLNITTDSSSLLPGFKPSQGNRMVFSAWVKQEDSCLCKDYDSNSVNFTFKRSGQSDITLSFKPSGNIIEGWQRYDTVIDIPADADSMRLSLKSDSHSPVYFDDVRMHPYNGNMKSFVYDPVSLRLMAELDENNYATFYEYDNDGTLIRVKKETERGIETIKETRSSLSKLNDQ